ncbi:hypothetical protein [Flavobacterium sp. MDT1-60]|nr:hypothetical protein [Flavobacterium sp. MDT1-60]
MANAIGLENRYGKVKSGFPASFVKFNPDLSEIETLDFSKNSMM